MESDESRARRISEAILSGLSVPAAGTAYQITKRGACSGCPPGSCDICGTVLPGDVYIINSQVRGKRHLSDKAVHYLGHGRTHYATGYVYRGEPVTVDLSLNELEGYLGIG